MATFLSLTLPAKTLWKNLDTFGVRDGNDATLNFCPKTLNSYFASANVPGQTVCPSFDEKSGEFSSSTGFAFSNVTPLEVFDAIFKINSNSVGLDDIPLRFFKLFIISILNHLTYIFNTSITSGIFRTAKIPLEPAHLRPISILPALSKALEILIMRDQMVCFLESVGALNVFQSGFRSGHSTVTGDIQGYFDRAVFVVLVLFDFSKAFDSDDHDLLCHKLECFFDFSSSAVGFIRIERSLCVSAGEVLSGF
jgi:hypothetical protein